MSSSERASAGHEVAGCHAGPADRFRVTILPGRDEFWAGPDEDLLTAALRGGIWVPYGCRHGNCGTCKHLLVDGEIVEGDISPYALCREEHDGGAVLLCSSSARSDLTIERTRVERDGHGDLIPPERFPATVTGVSALSAALFEVRLKPSRPLAFWAGQYLEIWVPGTNRRRSYSIASPPSSRDELVLVIRRLPGGASSAVVDRVRPGDVLDIEGPFGSLRFIESGRPVIMVALGHGIAPFLSMLRDSSERRVSVPITLYYGGSPEERAFGSELAGLGGSLAGFEVVQPTGTTGDGSGLSVLTQLVAGALRDASCYDAYLSGSPAMCDALGMLLAAKGLPEDRIRSEKFYPALR